MTNKDLQSIDDAITSHATQRWRKVAMIVGLAMHDNRESIKNVSDTFYAERVRRLVDVGRT